MKHLILILCSVFFIGTTFAQKPSIKWGKIPAKDLAMTTYEADPEADAVVLYDYGSLTFDLLPQGPVYIITRTKRIKILKSSAFDRGNITITYYNDSRTKFTLKAHVFQPDGKETMVSKKDIFDEKMYRNWHQKRVAMPDITEGCIIEYTYKEVSPYLTQLPTWYFQEDIPVRASELRTRIPDWFQYARLSHGEHKLVVSESESGNVNISGGTVSGLVSRYLAENVEGLKEEPYITTMNDYRLRIRFQLSAIKIPHELPVPYMTTWDAVSKDLLGDDYFGKQYLKKRHVQPIQAVLAARISALSSKKEKIQFIHRYITNNIEWDGSYRVRVNVPIAEAFKLRSGNSAEMNLMLLALLRANDIEAYPMLISTRSNGKPFPLYPFLDQFDHVIVYALADNDTPMILDAGDSVASADLLRVASLNKQGLVLISPEKTQWIDIKPKRSKDVSMATLSLDEEGVLKGHIDYLHSGYSAAYERRNYANDITGDYWVDRLAEQAITAKVDTFEYYNLAELNKPFKGKITCSFPEHAQVVDDFIYLSAVFYSDFHENPFKIEKRNYPVEIPYPFSEQAITNIKLPDGYIVEELPGSIKLELPNKGGRFTYSISEKDRTLQIVMRATITQLFYLPEEYKSIKDFYDIAREKLQEQIVLKRVE